VGGWIDLSLPEMKVRGSAEFVSIAACPPVESGAGHVIIGTFTHVGHDLVVVHVTGLADSIEVTSPHPFWSMDRATWVSAGNLQPGEHLATEHGTATVQFVAPEPGEQRVYSIKVETV
jgi:hypothetical protein